MTHWRLLSSIIFLFLIILILFTTLIIVDKKMNNQRNEPPQVIDYIYPQYPRGIDEEILDLGKSLFRSQCAICHSTNMMTDATGPALSESLHRWNNDTLRLASYLQNPRKYLAKGQDQRMIDLHIQFGEISKLEFPDLTIDDIKAIMEYVEVIPYPVH